MQLISFTVSYINYMYILMKRYVYAESTDGNMQTIAQSNTHSNTSSNTQSNTHSNMQSITHSNKHSNT